MSFKTFVASALLSLVVVTSIGKVASAAVITTDPKTCRETGGTPLPGPDGKDSNRCKLSDN
jgi:hypothetical protein